MSKKKKRTDSPTSRSTSYLFEMYDEGKTFTRKDGYSDVDVEYDEKIFPGMILIPEIDLEIDFFYGTIDEFNNVYNISDNVNLEDLNVCLPRTDNNDILKMEEYLEDEWIFSNFSTYFHSTKVEEEVAEFVKKNLKETQIKIVVGLEEGKIVIDKVSDGQWKVWQKRRRKQLTNRERDERVKKREMEDSGSGTVMRKKKKKKNRTKKKKKIKKSQKNKKNNRRRKTKRHRKKRRRRTKSK